MTDTDEITRLTAERDRLREAADVVWDWASWASGGPAPSVTEKHRGGCEDRVTALDEIKDILDEALASEET